MSDITLISGKICDIKEIITRVTWHWYQGKYVINNLMPSALTWNYLKSSFTQNIFHIANHRTHSWNIVRKHSIKDNQSSFHSNISCLTQHVIPVRAQWWSLLSDWLQSTHYLWSSKNNKRIWVPEAFSRPRVGLRLPLSAGSSHSKICLHTLHTPPSPKVKNNQHEQNFENFHCTQILQHVYLYSCVKGDLYIVIMVENEVSHYWKYGYQLYNAYS
jgi:hypothetical protein